jgi:hypothetical protein
MNRATYSPGIARLDTVSRLDRFLRDRETPIGPSYVQSILFGRRWMRGSTATGGAANSAGSLSRRERVAAECAAPAEPELEGPDPCAS